MLSQIKVHYAIYHSVSATDEAILEAFTTIVENYSVANLIRSVEQLRETRKRTTLVLYVDVGYSFHGSGEFKFSEDEPPAEYSRTTPVVNKPR